MKIGPIKHNTHLVGDVNDGGGIRRPLELSMGPTIGIGKMSWCGTADTGREHEAVTTMHDLLVGLRFVFVNTFLKGSGPSPL